MSSRIRLLRLGRRAALFAGAMASIPAAHSAPSAVPCSDVWGRVYQLANESPAMELGLRCDRSSTVQFAVEERADAPGAAAAPAVPLVWRGAGLVLVPDKGVRLTGMLMIEAHGGRAGDGARDDPALQRLIEQVARSYQQDSRLLNAIIHVESRFNPLAVSAKGAIGLMQVMPATAERMGLRDPERTLFDPLSNLHAGARYLRLLLDMFHGQLELAIAAYNAGEGAVLKYGGIPPYPETRAYVREVMRAAGFVNRE